MTTSESDHAIHDVLRDAVDAPRPAAQANRLAERQAVALEAIADALGVLSRAVSDGPRSNAAHARSASGAGTQESYANGAESIKACWPQSLATSEDVGSYYAEAALNYAFGAQSHARESNSSTGDAHLESSRSSQRLNNLVLVYADGDGELYPQDGADVQSGGTLTRTLTLVGWRPRGGPVLDACCDDPSRPSPYRPLSELRLEYGTHWGGTVEQSGDDFANRGLLTDDAGDARPLVSWLWRSPASGEQSPSSEQSPSGEPSSNASADDPDGQSHVQPHIQSTGSVPSLAWYVDHVSDGVVAVVNASAGDSGALIGPFLTAADAKAARATLLRRGRHAAPVSS